MVKKAFQILKLVSDSRTGMGISDISNRLDMSKSTVHGVTSALEEAGALIRDPITKRFDLGSTLIEIGRTAHVKMGLVAAARPVIEALMKRCRESVFLGVRNGERVTIIDVVESAHAFKITSPVGTAIPLMAGAVGKIFLSAMHKKEAAQFIASKGLRRYTDNTITDRDTYVKLIETVRQKGYATDDEEYISGVRAVAAPIENSGPYTAAVWVVGFKPDMDDRKMKKVIEETKNAAETISAELISGKG